MKDPTRDLLRPSLTAFRYQVQVNVTSLSVMLVWLFSPIIFGSVSALFYRSVNAQDLRERAVLGSAVTAVWTTSLFLSAITLGGERWSGVIELILATPTRLSVVMFGKLLANSSQGLIAAVIAVVAVSFISLTAVSIEKPWLLVPSALIGLVGVASFAFLFSLTLFISRTAVGVFAIIDTGLIFISAVLYPLSALPGWVQPISRLSPLRWATEALTTSASSNAPLRATFEAWAALGLCTIVYTAAGLFLYDRLERRLRRTGELATF